MSAPGVGGGSVGQNLLYGKRHRKYIRAIVRLTPHQPNPTVPAMPDKNGAQPSGKPKGM